MRREHINSPREILWVVKGTLPEIHRSCFPLGIPIISANLCVGLTFTNSGRVRPA